VWWPCGQVTRLGTCRAQIFVKISQTIPAQDYVMLRKHLHTS
jgi:hypothetical protein